MAELFKSTPASRVFGMGLPRRKVDNPGTIFGIEVDEPRWSLDPRLRRDMAQEQTLSMQEQALDAQQQYLQRQQRVAAAEDAAIAGIEAGEDIGNIFKNNPSLALSRNFNQFSNMAEMVRPSKAAQTLAPSIAKSIPAPYRDKYMALVNGDPRYAQDPLGAKTAVETEMGIDEQRGRLRKMGVDTSKLERRLYTPEEEADFEFRVKNDDPLSFYEKRKNLALERLKLWDDRDDTQIPDPKNPTLFVENPEFTKAKTLAMQAMDEHDAELLRRINPQAATATNITSPAAMGGGEQSENGTFQQKMQKASTPAGAAPTPSGKIPDLESIAKNEQLANIGSMNEDGLARVIESDQFSLTQKEKALESLKALEKAKFPNLDLDAVKAKKENVKSLIAELEPILKDARIFEKEVMPAYSKAMNDIETLVGLYAEQNGLDPANIYRSLEREVASNGELSAKGFQIAFDVLGEELAKTNNTYLGKVLEKENKSKSASQPIRSFIKRVFGGNQVNNAKILGRLARERIGNRVTPEWGGGATSMDVGLESSPDADEIARQYLP